MHDICSEKRLTWFIIQFHQGGERILYFSGRRSYFSSIWGDYANLFVVFWEFCKSLNSKKLNAWFITPLDRVYLLGQFQSSVLHTNTLMHLCKYFMHVFDDRNFLWFGDLFLVLQNKRFLLFPGLFNTDISKMEGMARSSDKNITRVLFCGPHFPASHNYTKEYLQNYPSIQVLSHFSLRILYLQQFVYRQNNHTGILYLSTLLTPDLQKKKLLMECNCTS